MTKQDILDRGWRYLGGFYYYWPYNTYQDEFSNRQISWRLNWVAHDKYLKIEAYERNSFDWETVYCGPCPRPSTLGYLMRLMKIDVTDDEQEDLKLFKK